MSAETQTETASAPTAAAAAMSPTSPHGDAAGPQQPINPHSASASGPLSPASSASGGSDTYGGTGSPLSPGSAAVAARLEKKNEMNRTLQPHEMMGHFQRARKRSQVMADGWQDVQERTFHRFINYVLRRRKRHIDSLKSGLSDGVALCHLIELLSGSSLPRQPKESALSQIKRLDNLSLALDFLNKQPQVHLVNIRPSDIEGGNIKIILGLVWSLIHAYSISKYQAKDKQKTSDEQKRLEGKQQEVNGAASAETKSPETEATVSGESASSTSTTATAEPTTSSSAVGGGTTGDSSAKLDLLRWVNDRTRGYVNVSDGAEVGRALDFSYSWKDGRILCALVDSLYQKDKKEINMSEDTVDDVEHAIQAAERDFSIPTLMDADDIVHRPQEHALMTYIACFREAMEKKMDESEEKNAVEQEAAAEKDESQPEQDDESTEVESPVISADALPPNEDGSIDEATVPLSPLKVLSADENEDEQRNALGAVNDEEVEDEAAAEPKSSTQPIDELGDAEVEADKDGDDAKSMKRLAARARLMSPAKMTLRGAFIDSKSLDAVVSPRATSARQTAEKPADSPQRSTRPAEPTASSPKKEEEADAAPTAEPSAEAAAAASSSSSAAPGRAAEPDAPDLSAPQDYDDDEEDPTLKEDAQGRRPNETIQQSVDRRIEQLMNDIEICVVTPDHKYLQSDINGVVRANELNTVRACWVILDGNGGWKFLRDYQSRYLAADADGRVYTSRKKPACRWRIVRGQNQCFVDSHGHYLTVKGGLVTSEEKKSDASLFRICFPVIEGELQKKGRSGLMRWQSRYFAFNGSVMSYWRQKGQVGKERPSGLYYPSQMLSVNINRQVPRRFNVVFKPTADNPQGKVVEFLAPSVEECCRWVRSLNSRGIKTVQSGGGGNKAMKEKASMPTDTMTMPKSSERTPAATAQPSIPSDQ